MSWAVPIVEGDGVRPNVCELGVSMKMSGRASCSLRCGGLTWKMAEETLEYLAAYESSAELCCAL